MGSLFEQRLQLGKVGQNFGSFYFHTTNSLSEAVLFLFCRCQKRRAKLQTNAKGTMILCGGKWSTRSAKMCQESPRSCKYENNVQKSGSGIAFEMLPIHPRALDGNVALKYDNVLSHER